MAKYLIDNIGDFVRQLSFTPVDTLALQLQSAEDLLHEIDTARAYPFDYVIFRITGYHRRFGDERTAAALLTGMALQHDLGLLIEQLSDRMRLVAERAGEPVLSIDSVTQQFNITSKTVQRWRRRGLPARRFLFADGKRRVGFLLSSVERFIRAHREQVLNDHPNISLVGLDERRRIFSMARRLATRGQCWPEEIARRIAKVLHRSPLTILHTIRSHDEAEPSDSIFASAPLPPPEKTRSRILRKFRQGSPVSRIARRCQRPKYAIYRVILDERIAKLKKRRARFIDDPLYHQPDAAQIIDAIASQQPLSAADSQTDTVRLSRGMSGPLQSLCRMPPLTHSQERSLFLKLNFHKFQFVQARRRLDPQFACCRDLSVMEHYLQNVAAVRNEIVTANLRLVVSIARKHLRPGLSLMDLISDGNLTLIRAVDGFDIHRGNRFSTYATLALMKGFARSLSHRGTANAPRTWSESESQPELEFANTFNADRRWRGTESVGVIDEVSHLLGRLTEPERRVIDASFGLRSGGTVEKTVREMADSVGLTTPDFRKIERDAMTKLRAESQTI